MSVIELKGFISIWLLLRIGMHEWRVRYRLFRSGRWSQGLRVPRSGPLDPYFHFLGERRWSIGLDVESY